MHKIINAEKIPFDSRKKVKIFIEKLLDLHKENVKMISLYGSAAGIDYRPKVSDINLLCIFEDVNFDVLKKSLKLVSWGISKRIAAPLFLSSEYIRSSLDVFPMEFLEMKENYILLYGEDLLDGLHIESKNIRLFCEEQIKGKLIRIRQAYLEIGLKKKGMEALLKESLNGLIPAFRNILRLKGMVPPIDKEKILSDLSYTFGLEKNIFLDILRGKKNDKKIRPRNIEHYMERFIEQIKRLSLIVDKL